MALIEGDCRGGHHRGDPLRARRLDQDAIDRRAKETLLSSRKRHDRHVVEVGLALRPLRLQYADLVE